MALVLADRVEQVTRTTGLGDLQLAETIRGRQSFQDVTNNGDTVIYVLEDSEGVEWEIGTGTVVHGTTTVLQRTTIRQSSNSDAKISLSAGTHRVFLVADAQYLANTVTSADITAAINAHEAEADPHPQYTTAAEAAAAAPVQSVNGETGTVLLDAADVGATPASHVGSGGAQHANATSTVAGFMSGADKTKLDGVEAGATADQSAAEVPYSNTTSGLAASDVQAAIDEIDGQVDANTSNISTNTGNISTNTNDIATNTTEIAKRTISGELELDVSGGADVTITDAQPKYSIIELTGTITANINIVVPDTPRLYTFVNSTSGSFTITVKTSAGSGVVVPQGELRQVRSDGTDVIEGLLYKLDTNNALGGAAQSWQDVTASRSAGVTYTNSSGRPILLSYSFDGAVDFQSNITIDGIIEVSTFISRGSSVAHTHSVVVPPDSIYSFTASSGGTLKKAMELR